MCVNGTVHAHLRFFPYVVHQLLPAKDPARFFNEDAQNAILVPGEVKGSLMVEYFLFFFIDAKNNVATLNMFNVISAMSTSPS